MGLSSWGGEDSAFLVITVILSMLVLIDMEQMSQFFPQFP